MRTPPSADTSSTDAGTSRAGRIDTLRLLSGLSFKRRVVLLLLLLVPPFALSVAGLARARTYVADVVLRPQAAEQSIGSIGAVAAQFGFSMGGGEAESPDYYAELLSSDFLLRHVAQSRFVDSNGVLIRLEDEVGVAESDSALAEEFTVRALRNDVFSVEVARRTGVITLSARSSSRLMSEQLCRAAMDALTDFNVRIRQARAADERQFTESRLQESIKELDQKENALRLFLTRNRRVDGSPDLEVEFGRIQRAVVAQEQLVLGLREAFEKARLSEMRATPVLSVLQPPRSQALPESRRIVLRFAVGLAVGGGLMLAAVFWMQGGRFDLNVLSHEEGRRQVTSRVVTLPPE